MFGRVSKELSFTPLLKLSLALTIYMVVSLLGYSVGESRQLSLFGIQHTVAQSIAPSDVGVRVYQQLPNLPRENQYISKETGKVAENNTLVNRLIRYHLYLKGRPANYRLDWKLTLADYLGANEVIYDSSYPGNDTLRQNPLEGDRAAIKRLSRQQRDALVQVLVNIFSPRN